MEKEKFLLTSFFTSNFVDIASTAYGLKLGFYEKGILGSHFVEQGNFDDAVIMRTAVTAIMIGLYALANKNKDKLKLNWSYTLDKSLKASNIISWGVAILNTTQIAAELLTHGR